MYSYILFVAILCFGGLPTNSKDLCSYCTCSDDSAVCPTSLNFMTVRSGGAAYDKTILSLTLEGPCSTNPDLTPLLNTPKDFFPNIKKIQSECCTFSPKEPPYEFLCATRDTTTKMTQTGAKTTPLIHQQPPPAPAPQASASFSFGTWALEFFLSTVILFVLGLVYKIVMAKCCNNLPEPLQPNPAIPLTPPPVLIDLEDDSV